MNQPLNILLTTPDYPPKLGGLSTFSYNIKSVLESAGHNVDIFVWKEVSDLKSEFHLNKIFDFGIHIHFMGGYGNESICKKNINFVHGSEILFTSPNILKQIAKKLLKKRFINYFERSYFNISISEFTKNKLVRAGLSESIDRDIIWHNCIELGTSHFCSPSIEGDTISFICVARDVPHKNLDETVNFCKKISLKTGKKIKLYITTQNRWFSNSVEIISIKDITDNEREELFKKVHFNLLFSLDHSRSGFYEGFGLTVLEAGKYGVPSIVSSSGGLPEAVHHNVTGWVLDNFDNENVFNLWSNVESSYANISKNVFEHTHLSHGLDHYDNLLSLILKKDEQ